MRFAVVRRTLGCLAPDVFRGDAGRVRQPSIRSPLSPVVFRSRTQDRIPRYPILLNKDRHPNVRPFFDLSQSPADKEWHYQLEATTNGVYAHD